MISSPNFNSDWAVGALQDRNATRSPLKISGHALPDRKCCVAPRRAIGGNLPVSISE
jgi:hypothetical protein